MKNRVFGLFLVYFWFISFDIQYPHLEGHRKIIFQSFFNSVNILDTHLGVLLWKIISFLNHLPFSLICLSIIALYSSRSSHFTSVYFPSIWWSSWYFWESIHRFHLVFPIPSMSHISRSFCISAFPFFGAFPVRSPSRNTYSCTERSFCWSSDIWAIYLIKFISSTKIGTSAYTVNESLLA